MPIIFNSSSSCSPRLIVVAVVVVENAASCRTVRIRVTVGPVEIARPVVGVVGATTVAAVGHSEIDGYNDDADDNSNSGDSVRGASETAGSLRVHHCFVTRRHYAHTIRSPLVKVKVNVFLCSASS